MKKIGVAATIILFSLAGLLPVIVIGWGVSARWFAPCQFLSKPWCAVSADRCSWGNPTVDCGFGPDTSCMDLEKCYDRGTLFPSSAVFPQSGLRAVTLAVYSSFVTPIMYARFFIMGVWKDLVFPLLDGTMTKMGI